MHNFRFWMHGMAGESPREVARELADVGFAVVVAAGDTRIAAVVDAGMESWLCGGAFRVRDAEEEGAFLAVSVTGEPREWFHSGCPNELAIRERNLQQYRQMAATDGVTGILVDGCRFASPASGLDAFLTCFCSRCETRAREMGFDFENIRSDVGSLRAALVAGAAGSGKPLGACLSPSGSLEWLMAHPGILDWLRFREACASEHLADVARVIRDAGKRVGMYVFTPSLAPLVGQSYRGLASHVDVFAPMIYRNYPKAPGPACLNWELTNIPEELGLVGAAAEEEAMQALLRWAHLDAGVSDFSIAAVRQGLPHVATLAEVSRAAALLPEDKELAPIVTIRDPEMRDIVDGARRLGARGVNFFSFAADWRRLLEGVVAK